MALVPPVWFSISSNAASMNQRMGVGASLFQGIGSVLGIMTGLGIVMGSVGPSVAVPPLVPQAQLSGMEQTNIRVYKRASPAVVSIEAERSTGSGVIVDSSGLILTNAHVIGRSQRSRSPIVVVLPDGRRLNAQLLGVGIDGLDLALLKVNGSGLPTVALAPPSTVQVGQRAFAIGNPFGRFQGTFTAGVVSRLDRERGLIQTDAAINPGNSGGPLLDSQGRLIGINTAIFTGRSDGNIGIGFAIATERVLPFLAAARSGQLPTTAQNTSQSQSLTLGTPIQGRLQSGDRQLPYDDSYYDIYTFNGRAGQRISAELTSSEFAPYLILLDSNGRDLVQSGADEGSNTARFVETLPSSGPYQIYVNSRFPGQTGAYSLRASLGGGSARRSPQPPSNRNPSPSPAPSPSPSPSQPSDPNVLFRHAGQLDRNSRTLNRDGSAFDDYYFRGRAGQQVVIDLDSTDFDSYLVLVAPDGTVLDSNDDRADGNPNATVQATLPEDGAYRVIVNAYQAGQLGRYQLVGRQQ